MHCSARSSRCFERCLPVPGLPAGVGIAGGMALFGPLKGVLLGPLLTSLMVVAYQLHAEFMRTN